MKLKEILASIYVDENSTSEELKSAIRLIYDVEDMKAHEIDVLIGVYKFGPLFDGDVRSKSARDSLMEKGFITKVVVKGEDGFNACTHKGRDARHILQCLGN